MRAAAWGLVLAGLFAGCADEPAPLVAPEPTVSDHDAPPGRGLAPLRWASVGTASGVVSLRATLVGVTVPPNTLDVLTNVTLDAGGAYGLRVRGGGCSAGYSTSFVGIGQTVGVNCGGISPGAADMAVSTDAGAMSARIEVLALVCEPSVEQDICPPALPVVRAGR